MIWGLHSGGWMSGLYAKAEDKHKAQVDLLAEFGLKLTSWPAKELAAMDAARRDQIVGWLRQHDIRVNLGVGIDFFADEDEVKAATEAAMTHITLLKPLFRPLVCGTGIARNYHHYSRDLPVAKQIDILSVRMAPLAKFCAAQGCWLSIHTVTHFGTDLAELCRRTPGLSLCFDTANCFLIGEIPLRAAEAVAPFTRATHFKDHYASPSFSPLGLKVQGATPGEGDCNLREIFAILKAKAPDPKNLSMELEIDPVRDDKDQLRDQREVLRQAVDFARSLK